jgi:hypothetical protein
MTAADYGRRDCWATARRRLHSHAERTHRTPATVLPWLSLLPVHDPDPIPTDARGLTPRRPHAGRTHRTPASILPWLPFPRARPGPNPLRCTRMSRRWMITRLRSSRPHGSPFLVHDPDPIHSDARVWAGGGWSPGFVAAGQKFLLGVVVRTEAHNLAGGCWVIGGHHGGVGLGIGGAVS